MTISELVIVFEKGSISISDVIDLFKRECKGFENNNFSLTFQFETFHFANKNSFYNVIEIKNLNNSDYYFTLNIESINDIVYIELIIDSREFQSCLFSKDWIKYLVDYISKKLSKISIYYSFDGEFDIETLEEDLTDRKIKTNYALNTSIPVSEYPAILKLYP